MEFIQSHTTTFFTFFTLISNIVFALLVIGVITNQDLRKKVYTFVYDNIILLLFSFSLIAVIGSLSYSEIVGFVPCDLCWFQRLFMYPQALLSLVAIKKKDKNIVDYLLPLSVIGGIIAFYHSLIHWRLVSGSFLACTSSETAPCAKVYVLEHGYITIPFMALSIFVYLITISVIYKKAENVTI